MSEFDSKRAKLRPIVSRDDIEDGASDSGQVEADTPRGPTKPKAAVIPLGRSSNRHSAGSNPGSNRRMPPPEGPDDDDPGPAAA